MKQKKQLKQPEYIFETSWEVCNMVGGIYTVLSTRAATLTQHYGDKLIFIGPEIWREQENPYFEENSDIFPGWEKAISDSHNLSIRIGRWKVPGQPVAVLVDFNVLMLKKNEIYGKVWETSGVNSLMAYGDYDESAMFGYASGMVIESFYQFHRLSKKQKVVAHFNEWMTSFGIFYIKDKLPEIATLFTTHATSIGRSIAGNHKPLYDYLHEYNGDQMAEELNMVSKHSAEKRAAHLVNCFTTVSHITAKECTQLLERKPDIVTPNGFENGFVPQGKSFSPKRKEARTLLKKVAETLLGYPLSNNASFIVTAGRYEFKNKGLDVFIESLKHLNNRSGLESGLKNEVVTFIMVPAWIKGPCIDLVCALNNPDQISKGRNCVTTHELHNPQQDPVLQTINWFHLKNKKTDKVKVIFVPAYLNGFDGIFNKTYYELLIGFDLSVFPSYYEPWGYTPLESIAFRVPTITTDLSGFGEWSSEYSKNITDGVEVIHRSDYNGHEVSMKIAETIRKYVQLDQTARTATGKKAAAIGKKALWTEFIQYYELAYDIALRKKI